MSQPASTPPAQRRMGGHLVTFLAGLALTFGVYAYVRSRVPSDSLVHRYLCGHWVEYVATWLFLWALAALGAKALGILRQKALLKKEFLPPRPVRPEPVARAEELLAHLARFPRWQQSSPMVRRLRDGLSFVHQRGSTEGLDDHLRTASDNDAHEVDGSYSLVRFITWAIPILGFLGTVLGITEAIANVTPEQLAKSISGVTDGLAVAFDTTALALGYSMCIMFATFVLDRGEQGLAASIDAYVDERLAHRFERIGHEGAGLLGLMDKHRLALTDLAERLVQRQADVWARSMEAFQARLDDQERRQGERLEQALRMALEQTLEIHAHRLATMDERFTRETAQLYQQQERISKEIATAVAALEAHGQQALRHAELLHPLLDAERQVLRLQETLQENLRALAQSGAFEEAVHSLTAAVHLLTGRLRLAALPGDGKQQAPDAQSAGLKTRAGNAA